MSRFRADLEHTVVHWSDRETCRAGTSGRDRGARSAEQSCGNPTRTGGDVADGVKRLTELQEKERSLPSPFAVPEPTVPASVQAEFNRLQSVIEGLQKELSAFRSGHAVHFSGVEDDDDDDMVVDLRHKKSKVGPKTPLAITGAAPATPPFVNGDSHQFRSVSGVSST